MAQTIRLLLPTEATPLISKAAELLQRTIGERSGARVVPEGGELTIELALQPGLGTEGFKIADGPPNTIRVLGNDERGVLYGVGKLLRAARYSTEEFCPGEWRGLSVPKRPVRGIYLATHFHNFYHDAPLSEITRYLEELALWGVNAVSVWFDMHHYPGFQDPEAREMTERLHAILSAGREVGMAPGLFLLANEGYADSPPELRATWGIGDRQLRWHYHVELCPNEPGAMDQLLFWTEERLSAFADCGLHYVCLWPYDQGGCCCHKCHPWGGNGYLLCSEQVADLARKLLPEAKIVLSTWDFDAYYPGEWEGLARALATRSDWVDYLMADGRAGQFDAYLQAHEVPGDLPVLGFPEISMVGRSVVWGGFGASPCPLLLQGLWDQSKGVVAGGFPYSEGIYEDINKVLFAGFYWDPERKAEDLIREYAAYEFAPEAAERVVAATRLLEQTSARGVERSETGVRFVMEAPEGAEEASALLEAADQMLPERARQSWRWRTLLLRGTIDADLVRNDFHASESVEAAMEELTTIYHAEQAEVMLAPPTRAALPELLNHL